MDSAASLLISLAWKSTALIAVAWGIAFALRGRSAALRHMVWTSAFGALLLLPVLSVALPALSVPREVPLGGLLATITVVPPALQPVVAGGPSAAASPTVTVARPGPDFRAILIGIWATGTALCLVRLLVACLGILKLRRSRRRLAETEANGIAKSLGMRGSIEVLAIPAGEMPSSFWNTVFLPVDATQWADQRRRAVLLHELAHVQRRDTAVQILARTAWSAYWWNPLAWMAWQALVDERERSVDDVVLQSGMGAADYASHLMDLARSIHPAGLAAPVVVAMARQSKLEVRIMAILDSKRDRRVPGKFMALGVIAAALTLFAPFAAIRAQEPVDLPADLDAMMRAAVTGRDAETLENMAQRAAGMADYDTGKKLMKAALEVRALASGELSKEYGRALLKMADLERRSGDPSARQDYMKALELLGSQPESAQAIIPLALTHIKDKNFDEGERMLERAITVDPRSAARATMWLAVVREKQDRLEDADRLYRSAFSLAAPQSEDAATILELHAQLLRTQSKPEEAGEFGERAQAIRRVRAAAAPIRPATSGVSKIGNGVSAPSVVQKVEPEYSEAARLARYQGAVVLSLDVGVDGTAQNLRVVRGLGLELGEKAVEAVRKWKFRPAMRNGEAVPVMATVEVNFRLL